MLLRFANFWVVMFAAFALAGILPKARAEGVAKPDIIEVIEIQGEIREGTATGVKEQVEKINDNAKIKAVLLVVNSPGGGASASAVLYSELGKLKVPVVALCEYLCASGGAYATMAPSVKFIAVRDDTIGGSIGVILHLTRYNRLLDWAKVDSETFKSGSLKDAGNPTRAITDADKAYFQGITDELAQKFYGVVGKARPKITAQQWEQIKSARIFIGPAVVGVGLADAVLTREEAIKKAKELSGSKLAFTREELKRMSKAADEGSSSNYHLEHPAPAMRGWQSDLATVVDMVSEIRRGEALTVEYRAPYTF